MLIEQIYTTSKGVRGTNRAPGDPVKGPHNAPKIVTVGHKAGVVGNVLKGLFALPQPVEVWDI